MLADVKELVSDLKKEIVDVCDKCSGRGWKEPKEPGVLNPCICMTVFYYLMALTEAGIPRDYWKLKLNTLKIHKEYRDFGKWYLERLDRAIKTGRGIIFLGSNGIGKTSLMCEIGKEAIVRGYSVRYFTVQQYVDALQENRSELITNYNDGRIILLDEMDKVYIKPSSQFVTKKIEDFIRKKTSEGKLFIICTNYDEKTLSKVFGQSTRSMLKRHLKPIVVEGKDYSDTLQDMWGELMDSEYDYYDSAIVNLAKRLMQRELREDALAWESQYS